MGFGLDYWIYWHVINTQPRSTGNCSAFAILHSVQFTVTHFLGFSVFNSHILATDLCQSHCNFKSYMKSSFHSLITFFHYSAIANSVDSIKFLYSPQLNWNFLYNQFATTQKTQPLYCWGDLFTAPLVSNGSYSFVVCVFVAAGMCIPSRRLAMNVYSDFSILLECSWTRVTDLSHADAEPKGKVYFHPIFRFVQRKLEYGMLNFVHCI
jgi:hypothetical protein